MHYTVYRLRSGLVGLPRARCIHLPQRIGPYIVRDVILPCPRVCAEQFGVIWAQYQRGLCPLIPTHSLSLSLSQSFSPYTARTGTRNWENKSQAPRLFTSPAKSIPRSVVYLRIYHTRVRTAYASVIYVYVLLHIRKTRARILCVCCFTIGNNFNFSPHIYLYIDIMRSLFLRQ